MSLTIGTRYRNPYTRKVYTLRAVQPDGDDPGDAELTVEYADGTTHLWFGHELEDDLAQGTLIEETE